MKKRLLIITYPLYTNYGGILQAFALQQVLKDMGFDVDTHLHWPKKDRIGVFVSFLWRFVRKYILRKNNIDFLWYPIVSDKEMRIISQNTRGFIYTHMSTVDLNKIKNVNRLYNAIIVGSDQVWRASKNMYGLGKLRINSFYLLDFVKRIDIKRIAYAVSFGLSPDEIKYIESRKNKKLVQMFDAVSVREDTGVDLCRDLLDVKAEHVLDPTFLCERSIYEGLIEDSDCINQKNIASYILDLTVEKDFVLKQIEQKLDMDSIFVGVKGKFSKKNISENIYPPVELFLRSIKSAGYVFTDSFHGCVFSIIFNKPFTVFINKSRGKARFDSLLRKFELEDRAISSMKEFDSEYISKEIDWDKVNSILKNERQKSKDFLMHNLSDL